MRQAGPGTTRDLCVAQTDARFEHVLSLIRSDTFGWADFFEPLVNSISSGGDFYLLANDFVSYLEAQARARGTLLRVVPCVSRPTRCCPAWLGSGHVDTYLCVRYACMHPRSRRPHMTDSVQL
jgi:hypothetical protein